MYLLASAAQGVRHFPPTVRASLKPGYLLLKPPTSSLPPIGSLTVACLYPDGRGSESSFLTPGRKTGKVSYTLVGGEQGTYRMVRELGGAGALQKLNKVAQGFEP